jgi:hypothetical protein
MRPEAERCFPRVFCKRMLELPEPPGDKEVRPLVSRFLKSCLYIVPLALVLLLRFPLLGQTLSLDAIVAPSTIIQKDGRTVTFAIHGFIEFQSLSQSSPYISAQAHRWPEDSNMDSAARDGLARALVREAVESRVISMIDERPLETLITHTDQELKDALANVKAPVPPGYADAFLAVQQKWKHSLNCWSAAPSIPARVLSNWYPIEEGIPLYGATYDSTEHFWQAVKYHPYVTVSDLTSLLKAFEQKDWNAWIERLDNDPKIYLPNAYAVEFLRHNLTPERLRWFADEIERQKARPEERARELQQRTSAPFRFTAFEEKVLWGDLADLFHLVYQFSPGDDPIRKTLSKQHFDGIYLGERKMGFISEEFRSLMLEIWKVKYLQIPRFRELIANIPMDIRLEHFLNDGDSPDIPIPIYVGYLNQIREMARNR